MNFFVEGSLRDLTNPNKPSTMPIGDAYMVGKIPGTDVHWGLVVGIVLAIPLHVLLSRTTFGFAVRVTGGNARAALAQGLPVGKLIVICCMHRRGLRGPCRLLRGGGDPGPRQRLARRGLWLHRHPGLVPGAAQSDRDHSGRDHVRRHRRLRRPDPAPHGSARCDRAGAAGTDLRGPARVRNALRPLQDFPGPGERRTAHERQRFVIVLFAIIGGALRVSTPFMFVALGECLTEKSGRVNLGLEGTLVLGAMSAYAISYHTGSPWLGVLAAGCAGSLSRRDARLHLQAAAGERHRHRHRHDAVRHRHRVLLRQGLHPAFRAAARLVLARRLDRQRADRARRCRSTRC